jgi:hypothetical protein
MQNKKSTINIIKKWWGVMTSAAISLMFTGKAKAQAELYGPPPILYGPAPLPTISDFIPMIGAIFVFFVLAPVIGLVWYHKHGGKRKWPTVVVKILIALFILALVVLILLPHL